MRQNPHLPRSYHPSLNHTIYPNQNQATFFHEFNLEFQFIIGLSEYGSNYMNCWYCLPETYGQKHFKCDWIPRTFNIQTNSHFSERLKKNWPKKKKKEFLCPALVRCPILTIPNDHNSYIYKMSFNTYVRISLNWMIQQWWLAWV